MTDSQTLALNESAKLADDYSRLKMAHAATRLQLIRYAEDLNTLASERSLLEKKLRFLLGDADAWERMKKLSQPYSPLRRQGYVLTDGTGAVGEASRAAADCLGGGTLREGSQLTDLFPCAQRHELTALIEELASGPATPAHPWSAVTGDGDKEKRLNGDVSSFVIPKNRHTLLSWVFKCDGRDSSAEDSLPDLETLFADSADGAVLLNAGGSIVSASDSFTKLMGFAEADLLNRTCGFLCLDVELSNELSGFMQAEGPSTSLQRQGWLCRRGGPPVLAGLTLYKWPHPLPGDACYWLLLVQDLSLAQHASSRMTELAVTDSTTGLLNRSAILARLDAQLRESGGVAVVMLADLDRFKFINDSVGPDLGDVLLNEAARRIAAVCGDAHAIGRVGADQFAICLAGQARHDDTPSRLAPELLSALAQPYRLGEREVFCTASIGITSAPGDADTAIGLLRTAERAVLAIKARGGNSFQRYTREWEPNAHDRLTLESKLRRAFDNHELQVHYQPLVDPSSGRVTGAEALLRWQNVELGVVPPAQFIPVAEETGLIIPIGSWVLNETCRQAVQWQTVHGRPLHVSVNVSPNQLHQPNFAATVREALKVSGLPPQFLDLEITESGRIEESDIAMQALHALKALGVTIAIDDFGTGYSSLSRLHNLPINRIKIDRSFVQRLGRDSRASTFIAAIAALARELQLLVTAEGVEEPAQADYLRGCGCNLLQGFLYGHPMPGDRFCETISV